jgi:proteic killer suppression protein
MIVTWKHKGLKDFFLTGSKKGIRPDMADRLRRRLDVLTASDSLKALGLPGFKLHPLTGDRKGVYSIKVTGNWRITFRFSDGEAREVDLEDYHDG